MKIQIICLAVAGAALFSSCNKKDSLDIIGSSTVLPVVSKAAEEYKKDHKNLSIVVNAGGSGVGINQLGEGKVEIGMASRDLKQEEIDKYPNVKFNMISVGKDAVAPVVSSEIYDAGVKALTLKQIGEIFSGQVTNWNQLGGPDKEILCVDKEKSRGTRHVFMKAVLGDEEAEAAGADLVLGSNNEEQTAIVQSDAAIGLLSNAWLNKDVKGLAIIMEDGSVIEPTIQNVLNGTFPISRDLFVITNGEPKGKVKEFIDYLLSEKGQDIVEEVGYVRIK